MKRSQKQNKKAAADELNSLFAELKQEYIDSFPEKISHIEKCWQNADRKGLESEFHKIKGTGTTYGIQEATQLAEVMEDLCHQGSHKLGLCVMISIDLLQKIRKLHKEDLHFDMSRDASFKFLSRCQDELESA